MLRRDRAFRISGDRFLHERAFQDCLERISLVRRSFGAALLVGCPNRDWPDRLGRLADTVDVVDPGSCFAKAVGGRTIAEDQWDPPTQSYDLCLAVGTLDTVSDLPGALRRLFLACRPDSLFLGALPGGNILPRLRKAMVVGDQIAGKAAPRVHPRIEPSTLAALLSATGFAMPVVDVDRVTATYPSLQRLIDDLRSMAATNVLSARSREPLSRTAWAAASAAFMDGSQSGKVVEEFEILHFAAWTPSGTMRHG